jgi:cell division protein FtsQ
MNLFQLDPDALQRAIAGHPWVRSVELRRHFPSTLVIAVTEHEPAAMASLGDLYLLDKEGNPFKRVQAGDAVDLPVVTGVERDDYVASPRRAAERFRGALEWLAAYDASDRPTGARLSEVKVEPLGFTLVTSSGVEVHVGDRPPAEELARLSRVAAELSRRGLTAQVVRLDNRVRPGWVAVKTAAKGSL